jgi:hypothetical protein
MQENAESLADDIEGISKFQIIRTGEETLPLVVLNPASPAEPGGLAGLARWQ